MTSTASKTTLAGITAIILAGCGGSAALSDTEQRYAAACIASYKTDTARTKCECAARTVASKLSPTELIAMEKVQGGPTQAWTEATAGPAGFALADINTLMEKQKEGVAKCGY